jgi:hypothetical protein
LNKRLLAWALLVFALVSWPLASFWFAKDEPQFVIAISELALIYESVNAIWHAEELDERGSGD